MFDKLTERLMETAMSAYNPQIQAISKIRVDELVNIKSKVRTNPEVVEGWFDKEITKLGSVGVPEILNKMKELES